MFSESSYRLEVREPLRETYVVKLMLSGSMTAIAICRGGLPWVADYAYGKLSRNMSILYV